MNPLQQLGGANPRGAAVARRVALGVAPVETRAARAKRAFTSPPHITYTVSKREIVPEELLQLYAACACGGATRRGSPTRQSHWAHWARPHDEALLFKVRMALHNSVAVAAAFSRDPRLTDDLYYGWSGGGDDDEYASSSGGAGSEGGWGDGGSDGGSEASGSGASSGSGNSLAWLGGLWGSARPARLVGFARAAGDYSLVATVHDVAIHPAVQGYGVGARLMKKVVTQVTAAQVFDVGLVTPNELQPFFTGCSFNLDREESVPMALGALAGGGGRERARVAASEELKRLLREL
ncbi:MAG: hypothetical protein J3K34DRAFT_516741 [Monoraphidium minutum]|nr:MAG: hypothetical protein J3K34DRAFT_516741 [Monoraphidium minutum]